MELDFKVLIPTSHQDEYLKLKRLVFHHIKKRGEYLAGVDDAAIERFSRLWADWLYVEEAMSRCDRAEISKYAHAFALIDRMLDDALNSLALSPYLRKKLRRELEEELKKDDQTSKLLDKLTKGESGEDR